MARAVVTGARRGIGREIALVLARAGHTVIATMRSTEDCDLSDIAGREHLAIKVARMDVADDASVAAFFASAVGSEPVDVLINNAGILSIDAVEDESMASMQAQMNTNCFGAVRCMQAVAPVMRTRGSGLIINISSIAGRMAFFGLGAYCASKFALEAISEAMAQELAPFGVRVAMVEPGIIATDMALGNLPVPTTASAYPHARRTLAFYADTGVSGTPPDVVAQTVIDIIDGRIATFRSLAGPDAAPLVMLRANMTDEAWIAMSDTLDDAVFFERFATASAL